MPDFCFYPGAVEISRIDLTIKNPTTPNVMRGETQKGI
jgi:hypothetical protein